MLGERLKKYITAKNITMYRCAKDCGVSPQFIASIISEKNKPGAEVLAKMAEAYPDLNVRWLLTGEGDMLNAPGPEPKAE